MRILHQRGHGLTKQKLSEAERATLSIILVCDPHPHVLKFHLPHSALRNREEDGPRERNTQQLRHCF